METFTESNYRAVPQPAVPSIRGVSSPMRSRERALRDDFNQDNSVLIQVADLILRHRSKVRP